MDHITGTTNPRTVGPVVVIVLAAGRGERFRLSGGQAHKLDALLAGKPVLQHVLDTVQSSGLDSYIVRPRGGTAGMGCSIALGVNATPDAAGWLILPGDLPLVQPASLRRVAQALTDHCVVIPRYRGRNGHPVGFARECFRDLSRLEGDNGASEIVQRHRQSGRCVDVALDDIGVCLDVDSVDDLREAEEALRSRDPRLSGAG